jgi:hypothetical protein
MIRILRYVFLPNTQRRGLDLVVACTSSDLTNLCVEQLAGQVHRLVAPVVFRRPYALIVFSIPTAASAVAPGCDTWMR